MKRPDRSISTLKWYCEHKPERNVDKHIKAVLEYCNHLEAQAQWFPIETAPKDGIRTGERNARLIRMAPEAWASLLKKGIKMGIKFGMRNSIGQTEPPNPNPQACSVIHGESIGDMVLLWVKYEGVTTYDGVKLLLYFKNTLEKANRELDPHFLEDYPSPVARFEPTKRGEAMAKLIMVACNMRESIDA